MKFYILGGILALLLFACAGEETLGSDNTPPQQPVMVPHLGDSGDLHGENIINYCNNVGYENNGIDAVPENDWIKIQWETFTDDDIDYLQIYRFNLQENEAIKIDSVAYSTQNYYFDQFANYDPSINKKWFYYIKVYDTSGNFSISDTTCYKLLQKPELLAPFDGYNYTAGDELYFQWNENAEVIEYRLLVFDGNYDLLWAFQPTDHPGGANYEVLYEGPELTSYNTIYWRVDAFGNTLDEEVNGTQYTIHSGSESHVYTIRITEQ